MENKKVFIALDSDLLRVLATYKDGPGSLEQKIYREPLIGRYENVLIDLLNFYDQQLVEFVVVSTVFKEVEFKPLYKNFISEICVVPKINNQNAVLYVRKMDELAHLYCEYKDSIYGETAMEKGYDCLAGKVGPKNDAFIMAEASILGLPLLTFNVKDFLQNQKKQMYLNDLDGFGGPLEKFYNDRVHSIRTINEIKGYMFDTLHGGEKVPPRPFAAYTFCSLMKSYDDLVISTPILDRSGKIDFKELSK